ncbi:hypothetical protein N9B31_00815 [Mariniblastus sp.]|nr:hypothetical protein [Mariniblastus sp.]
MARIFNSNRSNLLETRPLVVQILDNTVFISETTYDLAGDEPRQVMSIDNGYHFYRELID